MPERSRFVAFAAFALIAFGAWRLFAIVGATPMLGYANQYDMARISACVGLWPDLPAPTQFLAHPQAPVSRYVRGEKVPEECNPSSALAFVVPALALAGAGKSIDLRWIGAFAAVLLVALALALAALLLRHPAWGLAHGAVFAIVVGDPLNTLWLNTLYTEFAALLFLYASVVLLVVIAAREYPSTPPATGVVVAFAVSLIGLGLSRRQHLLLPVLLALPAVISLWRPALRAALAVLALVFAIASVQAALVWRHPTSAATNSVDVVLGAILPASVDPELTAQRLGLPGRCLQSVGATWYVPMGQNLERTCPEALAVPRVRELLLFITEPITPLRAALRALPQLQDWRLGYMGAVEGREYAGAEGVRAVAGAAAFSVAPVVTELPPPIFLLALTASLVLLGLSTIVSFAAAALERRAPLALSLYALTVTAWYAIATAIGGDGYVELPRHAQLATATLFATGVLLLVPLFAPLLVLVGGPVRAPLLAPIFAMGYATAALGIGALVQPMLRDAYASVPMAIGVVDLPKENVLRPGPVEVAGWALDPLGVTAVEIVTGTGEVIVATRDLPYAGGRGEPLALYYPSYPQRERAGFSAQLPARWFEHGAVEVRTVVVNAAGVRTEIDRRQLIAGTR
jgi:hypothetical protein